MPKVIAKDRGTLALSRNGRNLSVFVDKGFRQKAVEAFNTTHVKVFPSLEHDSPFYAKLYDLKTLDRVPGYALLQEKPNKGHFEYPVDTLSGTLLGGARTFRNAVLFAQGRFVAVQSHHCEVDIVLLDDGTMKFFYPEMDDLQEALVKFLSGKFNEYKKKVA